jgi:hypothetical protein
MSRVYIAQSTIHGTGVFAAVPLRPGEIVLKIDDSRVVTDAQPLDPDRGEEERHCDYLAGGKVVLMRIPERFINHCCALGVGVEPVHEEVCIPRVSEERNHGHG